MLNISPNNLENNKEMSLTKCEKYITDILNNKYFKQEEVKVYQNEAEENNIINVHPEIELQNWQGLGGALTNSTIFNLGKLEENLQKEIINSYFKELNYSFLRLPIGSTDFSVKSAPDYLPDFENNVKIIQEIKKIKDIKIVATPWSPPAQFKNNSSLYGGKLLKDKYNEYANYLIKFIEDYGFYNINIDYLCIQNEPFASQTWESCKYSIDEMKELIYNVLIPKLKTTKIMLWEHNKDNLYNVIKALYEPNSKVKAVGFHWYTGAFFEELDLINKAYPELLLFETEMCCGYSKYNKNKWITDGEYYLNEIIGGLHHNLNAFIDWNLLLDFKGGPNHKNNFCKSPIILEKNSKKYIKTPIFYYLKHLGIAGNAKVVATSNYSRDCSLQVVSLKNEKIYIIVLNKSDKKQEINIRIGNNMIKDKINKHTVITYVIPAESGCN